MQIDGTLARRFRLVYPGLNDVVAAQHVDEDEQQRHVFRWLEALMRSPVPRRLFLPAREDDREPGPPCPVCDVFVDRSEDLVACTSCLRVSHRTCLPERRACACGEPGARG